MLKFSDAMTYKLCVLLPVSYHPTDVQSLKKDTKKLYSLQLVLIVLTTANDTKV